MTNPPYVVRGTGKQREFLRHDPETSNIILCAAVALKICLQSIINGLKPGARALVIVPDGLLLRHSEAALKAHMLRTCDLEAVISLPVDSFYSTPKKTYILVIRKKQMPGQDTVQSGVHVSDYGSWRNA